MSALNISLQVLLQVFVCFPSAVMNIDQTNLGEMGFDFYLAYISRSQPSVEGCQGRS